MQGCINMSVDAPCDPEVAGGRRARASASPAIEVGHYCRYTSVSLCLLSRWLCCIALLCSDYLCLLACKLCQKNVTLITLMSQSKESSAIPQCLFIRSLDTCLGDRRQGYSMAIVQLALFWDVPTVCKCSLTHSAHCL